jgi:steroid 5-alpha reductase family enzyme
MVETGSHLRELISAVPLTIAVTFAVFTILWLISLKTRDASIVDQYWAIGFAVIGWTIVLVEGLPGGPGLALLLAVTIWSARLGLHLSVRHLRMMAEDPRYAAIRQAHEPGFALKSLPMIFWLQAALMCIIAIPIYAALLSPLDAVIMPVFILGMVVFAAGFLIEAVADHQLRVFKRENAGSRRLLRTGLWALSRHPHYFGEALVWTGLAIAALSISGEWWVLISPIMLTTLLLKVSGIPPLEKHLSATREGYKAYRTEVNAFIPGPPRQPSKPAAAREPAE